MQVDINRLKNYEIEEGFKELTYDAFEKNGALLKFIQSILSQIQENRVDASADMEKRAIELLTSEFSRLITAYLEDESFLDRLDEYVALAFSGTGVETPTVKAEQQETPEKKTVVTTTIDHSRQITLVEQTLRKVFDSLARTQILQNPDLQTQQIDNQRQRIRRLMDRFSGAQDRLEEAEANFREKIESEESSEKETDEQKRENVNQNTDNDRQPSKPERPSVVQQPVSSKSPAAEKPIKQQNAENSKPSAVRPKQNPPTPIQKTVPLFDKEEEPKPEQSEERQRPTGEPKAERITPEVETSKHSVLETVKTVIPTREIEKTEKIHELEKIHITDETHVREETYIDRTTSRITEIQPIVQLQEDTEKIIIRDSVTDITPVEVRKEEITEIERVEVSEGEEEIKETPPPAPATPEAKTLVQPVQTETDVAAVKESSPAEMEDEKVQPPRLGGEKTFDPFASIFETQQRIIDGSQATQGEIGRLSDSLNRSWDILWSSREKLLERSRLEREAKKQETVNELVENEEEESRPERVPVEYVAPPQRQREELPLPPRTEVVNEEETVGERIEAPSPKQPRQADTSSKIEVVPEEEEKEETDVEKQNLKSLKQTDQSDTSATPEKNTQTVASNPEIKVQKVETKVEPEREIQVESAVPPAERETAEDKGADEDEKNQEAATPVRHETIEASETENVIEQQAVATVAMPVQPRNNANLADNVFDSKVIDDIEAKLNNEVEKIDASAISDEAVKTTAKKQKQKLDTGNRQPADQPSEEKNKVQQPQKEIRNELHEESVEKTETRNDTSSERVVDKGVTERTTVKENGKSKATVQPLRLTVPPEKKETVDNALQTNPEEQKSDKKSESKKTEKNEEKSGNLLPAVLPETDKDSEKTISKKTISKVSIFRQTFMSKTLLENGRKIGTVSEKTSSVSRKKIESTTKLIKNSAEVVSNMDKHVGGMTNLDFKHGFAAGKTFIDSFSKKLKKVGKSVLSGALSGIKMVAKSFAKNFMFAIFGPLAYIFTPIGFVVSTLWKVTSWVVGAIYSTVKFVLSPFLNLFKKHHDKEMAQNESWIAKTFKFAFLTPQGMLLTGFLSALIYGRIKKYLELKDRYGELLEIAKDPNKELTPEQRKQVEDLLSTNLGPTPYLFLACLFGTSVEDTMKALGFVDDLYGGILDLFLGKGKAEELRNKRMKEKLGYIKEQKDEQKKEGEKRTFWWDDFISTLQSLLEYAKTTAMSVYDFIVNNETYKKYFEDRSWSHTIAVFSLFAKKWTELFMGEYKSMFTRVIATAAVGTIKDLINATPIGSYITQFAFSSYGLLTFGTLILVNGVEKGLSDVWKAVERIAETTPQNVEIAVERLNGNKSINPVNEDYSFGGFGESPGLKPFSISGIANIWKWAENEVTRQENERNKGKQAEERLEELSGLPAEKLKLETPDSAGAPTKPEQPEAKNISDSFVQIIDKWNHSSSDDDSVKKGEKQLSRAEIANKRENFARNLEGLARAESNKNDNGATKLPITIDPESVLPPELSEQKLVIDENKFDIAAFKRIRAIFIELLSQKYLTGKYLTYKEFAEMYNLTADPNSRIYKLEMEYDDPVYLDANGHTQAINLFSKDMQFTGADTKPMKLAEIKLFGFDNLPKVLEKPRYSSISPEAFTAKFYKALKDEFKIVDENDLSVFRLVRDMQTLTAKLNIMLVSSKGLPVGDLNELYDMAYEHAVKILHEKYDKKAEDNNPPSQSPEQPVKEPQIPQESQEEPYDEELAAQELVPETPPEQVVESESVKLEELAVPELKLKESQPTQETSAVIVEPIPEPQVEEKLQEGEDQQTSAITEETVQLISEAKKKERQLDDLRAMAEKLRDDNQKKTKQIAALAKMIETESGESSSESDKPETVASMAGVKTPSPALGPLREKPQVVTRDRYVGDGFKWPNMAARARESSKTEQWTNPFYNFGFGADKS